jgi:hypothetical protein
VRTRMLTVGLPAVLADLADKTARA